LLESAGGGGSIEPRSKYAISYGMIRVREVHDVDATLIPALHVEVAPRHRDEAPVVRDAVLLADCAAGSLKYARCVCFLASGLSEMIVLPPSSMMLPAWHIGPCRRPTHPS
jgi:hypothetical protein